MTSLRTGHIIMGRTWITWLSFARLSLPSGAVSWTLACGSSPSLMPMPCSLGVARCELDLEGPESCSLGLLVLVGFVLGEFAGDAVTGGARGC